MPEGVVDVGVSVSVGGAVSSPVWSVGRASEKPGEVESSVVKDPVERWLRYKKPTTKANYLIYFERFRVFVRERVGVDDPSRIIS